MAITAKARARLQLRAETRLGPITTLGIVKAAAATVKGGGTSLLTSGLKNIGAQVNVDSEAQNRLQLTITSGRRLVRLCSLSAEARAENGHTQLRVGGLEWYRTNQPRVFYVIPAGPKSIAGMDPYKRFLEAVRQGVLQDDPAALVTVATPDAQPTAAR